MRMIMLSLLAVLACGTVAAATASAQSYWVEHKQVTGEEEFGVEGTSGTSKLEVQGLVTIECEKDEFSGTIRPGGKSTAVVKFRNCKVVGLPECTVTEPIEFKARDTLVVADVAGEEKVGDEFQSEGFTIKLKGSSCTVKGSYEVKGGRQQCEISNAETEAKEHEIICEPAGSELKFGEKEVNLTYTEKVKLTSDQNWSAHR